MMKQSYNASTMNEGGSAIPTTNNNQAPDGQGKSAANRSQSTGPTIGNTNNDAIMHSRKQKFMHHQLSKSNAGSSAAGTGANILATASGGGSGLQNAKHKVNLSADINLVASNMA